jgi:hypothetical protein
MHVYRLWSKCHPVSWTGLTVGSFQLTYFIHYAYYLKYITNSYVHAFQMLSNQVYMATHTVKGSCCSAAIQSRLSILRLEINLLRLKWMLQSFIPELQFWGLRMCNMSMCIRRRETHICCPLHMPQNLVFNIPSRDQYSIVSIRGNVRLRFWMRQTIAKKSFPSIVRTL